MAVDFPSTDLVPNVTTYTSNGRTWLWDGVSWRGKTAGYTGSRGPQGPQGPQGYTGSSALPIPTASTTSSTASLSWNSDSFDMYIITAQAEALAIPADSGTPAQGRKMLFRIKDNGTARAISWTTGASKAFRALGITLPTTTVISKTVYVGCVYNSTDSRWDVVAVSQEA